MNKFSVTLPKGWQVINDPTRADKLIVSGLAGTADKDPSVLAAATAAFNQGAKLLAVDTNDKPSTSNVTVLVKAAAGINAADIMQVVPSAEQQLSALNATDVHDEKITLDGGPAAQVDYQYNPAGGSLTVIGHQFYLIRAGNAYITTISTKKGASAADGDLIVHSLHFG